METLRFPKIKEHVCRLMPFSVKLTGAAVRGSQPEDENGKHIFVKGFKAAQWTHADLYEAFKEFGEIVSCKVSLTPEHKSIGYGYVQFKEKSTAANAIKAVTSFQLREFR